MGGFFAAAAGAAAAAAAGFGTSVSGGAPARATVGVGVAAPPASFDATVARGSILTCAGDFSDTSGGGAPAGFFVEVVGSGARGVCVAPARIAAATCGLGRRDDVIGPACFAGTAR